MNITAKNLKTCSKARQGLIVSFQRLRAVHRLHFQDALKMDIIFVTLHRSENLRTSTSYTRFLIGLAYLFKSARTLASVQLGY
jgi:hypothetical protein